MDGTPRCTKKPTLYGPEAAAAALEQAAALDPETAALLAPPRPASYYDDYHTRPPLIRTQPVLPPMPENATPEQLREWADRCHLLRCLMGSGN